MSPAKASSFDLRTGGDSRVHALARTRGDVGAWVVRNHHIRGSHVLICKELTPTGLRVFEDAVCCRSTSQHDALPAEGNAICPSKQHNKTSQAAGAY
eukprot:COSAG06_NODE_1368_length_9679_cov_3.238055_6_plen_97_part_00